jgi:hypothetical protein
MPVPQYWSDDITPKQWRRTAERVGFHASETLQQLGQPGAYGAAYDLHNDTVLKVTTDEVEAEVAFHLQGTETHHLIRYLDTFQIVEGQVFGIVAEKLEEAEREWVVMANDLMLQVGNVLEPYEVHQATKEWFAGTKSITNIEREFVRWIRQAVAEAEALDVTIGDFHSGNIMRRKSGEYVLTDLGGQSVSPASYHDIPVAARLVVLARMVGQRWIPCV